jgi:queuosine biosynthesis protein QueC
MISAALAREAGYRLYALSIDYNQRHQVELAAARQIARQLGAVRHVVLPIDLSAFGGSALTADIDVPKDGVGEGIPITYVPARNTVFLSLALAWAETVGARALYIGVNALDYSGYPDCRPDFIAAFDTRTGTERWRQKRDEPTGWSTPLIVDVAGKPQVVVNATGKIRAYDLTGGSEVWSCSGMTANAIPTPVAANGVLFATSGFRGAALMAIRLGRSGDLSEGDAVVWKHAKNTPYVPSPLYVDDRIYLYSGNNAMLSVFDAKSGQVLIDAQRVPGMNGVYASPVAAAGRVYLLGRDGATVVLKRADQFEVLATNKLEDSFDASPAIVGKQLFLRGHENLYCISE